MKLDHKWIESYAEALQDNVVLELGCGSGIDTQVISKYAKQLVSGDLVPSAGNHASIVLDHSQALPFEAGSFDTIVASLCLHYFRLEKTKDIVAEISRILKTNGTFICRLNSYKDEHYGAVGYPEIESGLYDVKGSEKRFFNEHDIRMLWGNGYLLCGISHRCIDRYEKAKYIYEFSAKRL